MSFSTNSWLNQGLISEIRQVFEPRYGKNITDAEVIKIALSLCELTETLARNKDEKYQDLQTRFQQL